MRTSSIAIPLHDARKAAATLNLPGGVQILGAHIQDAYTVVIDYMWEQMEPVLDPDQRIYVEAKRMLVHFQLAKTGDYLSRNHAWCAPLKVGNSEYLFYAFK